MAVILDTDLITIFQDRIQPGFDCLVERLVAIPSEEIRVSAISLEEQMRGRLAEINSAQKPDRLLRAYRELLVTLEFYCNARVLPFDQAAFDRFTQLHKQRVRIGTMDLRIASIALSRGDMVLTRNLRHFRQVPDLAVEDWTRPEK